MSDVKLRELERRWRETRALGDGAALVRERVRVGAVSPNRLSVLDYASVEPFPMAVRVRGSTTKREPDVLTWALPLSSLGGKESGLLAGAAAMSEALASSGVVSPISREAIDCAMTWVTDSSHRADAVTAAQGLYDSVCQALNAPHHDERAILTATKALLEAVTATTADDGTSWPVFAIRSAECCASLTGLVSVDALREAIVRSLVNYASE